VIGDPSSGKSTLVRRIALDAADGGEQRLPVPCRAVDLAARLRGRSAGPDGHWPAQLVGQQRRSRSVCIQRLRPT